jgi:hypothetical protein
MKAVTQTRKVVVITMGESEAEEISQFIKDYVKSDTVPRSVADLILALDYGNLGAKDEI